MARVLGLDLGSSSIGWAVIDYSTNIDQLSIIGMGSRVIPIDGETLSKFNSGQSIDINAKRTARRTARKMLDRYQQRRAKLDEYLTSIGIPADEALITIDRDSLWELRAKAASERISLTELHRVLMHINQKRGYNASKSDLADKEGKGYVADVRGRYLNLKATGLTIGQFYNQQLKSDPNFSVKGTDRVLPRAAYIEEVTRILDTQKRFYPEILTPDTIDHIINFIMFYQRPLKSCKHLVGECEHMARKIVNQEGNIITVAPKVAQKSNPLFEECRIWQAINHLILNNKANDNYELSPVEKQRIYNHLRTHKALKTSDLYAILFNSKRPSTWHVTDSLGKGIPGNRTVQRIADALGAKYKALLTFDINVIEVVDKSTGEIRREVNPDVIEQPLYRLWHTLYSISDIDELKNTLRRNFGIVDEDILDNLCSIDFAKDGYGNMSVKAIRKILPYLMEGEVYSKACEAAGFRHSDYMTSEENESRELLKRLPLLKKGELRQPIVEKILNQTVNVVNTLLDEYGPFDEIHVEMARELQQSKDERNKASKNINDNERRNKALSEKISTDYGLTPTRTRVTKLKLWEESSHRCIYCDSVVNGAEFLEGINYEVEHIIPKSLLFDDSYSNKVCSCRRCNHEKGNMTGRDYMESKGERALNEYLNRVNALMDNKTISKTKHRYLTMTAADIPDDFIDRQLRQSQYIARKATEMMRGVCRTVVPTSGTVTAFLRHLWGWNTVLHDINYPRYALNENLVDAEHHKIKEWDKRSDHRHHAIDALAIACTTRSIIKRLNDISSLKNEELPPFLGKTHTDRLSRVERYALSLPHFSTSQVIDAAARILISVKPATRLTTPGKRYQRHGRKAIVAQSGISVPRGPLHEETVHGTIQRYDPNGQLTKVTVVRRPLASISSLKEAEKIVDTHIRRLVTERLKSSTNPKNAFAEPLYSDSARRQAIKYVRCFTNLSAAIPIRYNSEGAPIAFVKAGTNHHVAIYRDESGKLHEHVVTFMHAVERSNRSIPPIIKNPAHVWSTILESTNEYPDDFLAQLPADSWTFVMSMQRNEMFVLGLSDEEFDRAISDNDHKTICEHLFRVQSLSSKDYNFCLHTLTNPSSSDKNKPDKRLIRIRTLDTLKENSPRKVAISPTGAIKRIE